MEEESGDISNHLVTGRLGGHYLPQTSAYSHSSFCIEQCCGYTILVGFACLFFVMTQ